MRKKTSKHNKVSKQGNLIEPSIMVNVSQLLAKCALSENEQGILKRRLLENQEQFGKFLQFLLQEAAKKTGVIDISQSLKKLEKDEGREIRSFDSIAKVLAKDFPELLRFILDEYQVDATKTRALIGKEFVFIKRIADVIFEAKDQNGNDVIIHLEFERKYESDEHMDKRNLEYRHLMEMDEDYEGKVVLCNVFYLRGSPEDKQMIEDRTVKLPCSDPRYSGELKYKAYHLSLMTIETIIEKKLPFLFPFVVESELRSIETESTATTNHIVSLQQEIDSHEEELTKMIEGLTTEKMESLRTVVEYLWGRAYSKEMFNKSTLVRLMREQLNLRQTDILLGRKEGVAEGIAKGMEKGMAKGMEKGIAKGREVVKKMAQEGELTREQMEKFIRHLKE